MVLNIICGVSMLLDPLGVAFGEKLCSFTVYSLFALYMFSLVFGSLLSPIEF